MKLDRLLKDIEEKCDKLNTKIGVKKNAKIVKLLPAPILTKKAKLNNASQ